jgi:hypothetical protein
MDRIYKGSGKGSPKPTKNNTFLQDESKGNIDRG